MTFDQLIIDGQRPRRVGYPPARRVTSPLVRINGELERWTQVAPLTAAHLEAIAARLLPPVHQERLQTKLEVDVAWQAAGVGRIRASVFRQRGTIAVSMRLIPDKIPSLEALGLPPSVVELAEGVARPGARHRRHRQRQEHDARGARRSDQPHAPGAHPDDRRPDRVRPRGRDGGRHAARDRLRHADATPPACAARCVRTRTSFSSAKCATPRRSRRRWSPPRPATSCSRRCTRSTRRRPSTASSRCSRRTSSSRSAPAVARAAGRRVAAPDAARRRRGRALAAEVLIATPLIRDCIEDRDKTEPDSRARSSRASRVRHAELRPGDPSPCKEELVTHRRSRAWVTNVEEFRMRLRGITAGSAAASRWAR